MLVRQAKNAFIRFYDGEGYIMNQMTRYDRVYNETGTDFLREISRTPKDINSIVDNLSRLYGDFPQLWTGKLGDQPPQPRCKAQAVHAHNQPRRTGIA